jgi:hypothetical protein
LRRKHESEGKGNSKGRKSLDSTTLRPNEIHLLTNSFQIFNLQIIILSCVTYLLLGYYVIVTKGNRIEEANVCSL